MTIVTEVVTILEIRRIRQGSRQAPIAAGSAEIDAGEQPRDAASGPKAPLAATDAVPTGSAVPRKEKAQQDLEKDRQLLDEFDGSLKRYQAVAADQTRSRRERAAARFTLARLKVGRSAIASHARMAEKELRSGPLLSERLDAKRDQEFAQAQASFARAKVKWHRGRAVINSDAASLRPAKYGILFTVIGWAYIAPLLAADYLVFRAFGINYFHWYLQNGALINLIFGFVSLAVVLDAYPDLISSNALRYTYAYQQLVGHVFRAWRDTTYESGATTKTWWLPTVFDFVVSMIVFIIMGIAVVGWALIIGPVQHVAYLVLGAPARNAIRNNKNPRYNPKTDTMTPDADEADGVRRPSDDADKEAKELEHEPGFVIGYREKPVSLTAALAAATFFIIGALS